MTNSEYDEYIRRRSSSSSSNNYGNNNYGYNSARNREPCMPISMKPAINQDEFYDMRFCGTRGGEAFLNAKSPTQSGTS